VIRPSTTSGLRVSEATSLRWGAVDLAAGRLNVADSKTSAGVRTIDLSPDLRDDLLAWKAKASSTDRSELVFATRDGAQRNRQNVRANVLGGAVKRANEKLGEQGRAPIVGCTNHTLRRTCCALLYAAGASPAYVMAMLGHESASLSLEMYAAVVVNDPTMGARVDAILRGPDWDAGHSVGTLDEIARA
jgi:integrase